ncbi:MAG: 5-formyltetrahydrofolate cyclo-ligase [Endomicrobiales bacterium]
MNGFSAGDSKAQLRQKIKSKRDAVPAAQRVSLSALVMRHVFSLELYRTARTIMAYCAHGSEVVTDALISQALLEGKTVAVPQVVCRTDCTMQAIEIRSLAEVFPGEYGIREPRRSTDCVCLAPGEIDVVFVPGIAFDCHGYRVGFGKGFYDRWLESFPAHKLVGLAYDFQVVESVPREKHDGAVGVIVTDTRIISVR